MQIKHILSAVAVIALMLGPAGFARAQQSTTDTAAGAAAPAGATDLREVEDGSKMVQPFNINVDALDDMDIVGPGNEEIGEVDEVLMDASGQVVAVVAEVGGFLGIGEKEVVIKLDQLQLQNDQLVTSLNKEQLKALSPWEND